MPLKMNGDEMNERIRGDRLIVAGSSDSKFFSLATIYLGLYNGTPYLDSLLKQLLRQRTDVQIVVVDNCSTDGTWNQIQPWLQALGPRLTLVKNPLNLGGAGSLSLNSDLIQTPWFLTLHQDDYYKPSHVDTLCQAIESAEPEVICISTEMGRLSPDGEKERTPVRASWFLPDYSPATIFLSNLRMHNVPFPAACFKKSEFFLDEAPWHSTAFPDTEWVLRAATKGKFKFVQLETMLYRENPLSESHSLDIAERNLGALTSLMRVFASSSFKDLASSIASKDRDSFTAACLKGIDLRLSGLGHFGATVKLLAAEQLASAWNYQPGLATQYIADLYQSIGSTKVPLLLKSLTYKAKGGHDFETEKIKEPSIDSELISSLGGQASAGAATRPLRSIQLVATSLSLLPRRAKKLMAKIFTSLPVSWTSHSFWGYKWKK